MASTPSNAYAGPKDVLEAPVSASQAMNQGDIVKVASNLVLPVAAVADTVFGIVDETNPVASLGDDLTKVSVLRSGIFFLVLKNGDSINFDDVVYISSNVATNPQEVSTSSANSATKVGHSRELASITGDGSKRVKIELFANPSAS